MGALRWVVGILKHTTDKSRFIPWTLAGAALLVLGVVLAGSTVCREAEQELLQVLSRAYPQLAACPDFTHMQPAEGASS